MALTYIFAVQLGGISVPNASGSKTYTANAQGIITGVAPADALGGLQSSVAGGVPKLIAATGATADGPNTVPATALTGALNNLLPPPFVGLPFYDTTLPSTAYFVGTQSSSNGWVDRTGAAI
jgi:hypothetical protein